MDGSVTDRLVDLESRLTFMQATIDELNQIVTNQQRDIDELARQLRAVLDQARGSVVEKDPDFKPPHY